MSKVPDQIQPAQVRSHRSPYGLEFALLIVLPIAVLLAGAATFALAVGHGFTPVPEIARPLHGH